VRAPLTGILNVYKEAGWTSHDVVAKVRRLAGHKRVGHAGTLDPLAEGVLLVLLGRATRLAEAIQAGEKRYQAWIRLGLATSTDDAEGEVTATRPVPQLTSRDVEAALERFRGTITQVPPAYSAIKVDGRRAYALARRGETPALAARQVTITDLRLVQREADCLVLEVGCSKGTYVRSLARDLAAALGTVGHLDRLVRTQVGPFQLADALTLGCIAERGFLSVLLPPEAALPHAPVYPASSEDEGRLTHGQPVPARGLMSDWVRVHDASGRLVCVGSADGERLRPRIVL
jgi:tRNA pseudouridine55 synthase